MEDIIRTVRGVFLQPGQFFESVEREKSYIRPWLYFSISYIILIFFSTIIKIPEMMKISDMGPLLLFIEVFGMFISISFAFAIPFIIAGLSHLGLLIFGARKGFLNTFKPVAYSGMIYVIYGLMTAVLSSIAYLLYPSGLADAKSSGLSYLSSAPIPAAFLGSLVIVVTFAGWIHFIAVDTIGVARFHGISKTRAFFGIIIVPLFILAIVGLLAGGLFFMINGGMPTGMVTFH